MSFHKTPVGIVAAIALVVTGIGFSHFSADTDKLHGLQKELIGVRTSIVDILREKQKQGQVSMPDLIQAEIDLLQASLEVCGSDAERHQVLNQMEAVYAKWERLSEKGLEMNALTRADYLRVKAKRISLQIEGERMRLKMTAAK